MTKASNIPKSRMNKTEEKYTIVLLAMVNRGEIKEFHFESFKMRIGDNCWYTPDFMVIDKDDNLVFVEVKGGFIRDDAMVKFKAVASLYPRFKFKMVQYSSLIGFKTIAEN